MLYRFVDEAIDGKGGAEEWEAIIDGEKRGRSIFRSIEENWKRCVERGDSWTLGINLCGATLLERAWPWACCWGAMGWATRRNPVFEESAL